jgi:hypothetical protein
MKIQQNVGTADRFLRVALAVAIGALAVAGTIAAPLSYFAAALAAILLVTGTTGFCPIYAVLRVRTRPAQQA